MIYYYRIHSRIRRVLKSDLNSRRFRPPISSMLYPAIFKKISLNRDHF